MSNVSTFGSFSMAKLAIYASQKAMAVTGNNISNINTPGYTRQSLDLNSLYVGGADQFSSKWDAKIGSGVIVSGVSQIRSPYLDIRYRTENTNVGQADKRLEALNELNRVMDEVGDGTGDEGVMEAALQGLIEQLEYYTTEGAGRDDFDAILRGKADEICKVYNTIGTKLEQIQKNQEASFKQDVETANEILKKIQHLNIAIRKAEIHGSAALELKDERNMQIDELSKYVGIDVMYEEEDIGGGFMVDKLVIKIAATDSTNKDIHGKLLVDGQFAGQFKVEDLEETDAAPDGDEQETVKPKEYKMELGDLKDRYGLTAYKQNPIKATETVFGFNMVDNDTNSYTLKIDNTEVTFDANQNKTVEDKLKEFAEKYNADERNANWSVQVVSRNVGTGSTASKEFGLKFTAKSDGKLGGDFNSNTEYPVLEDSQFTGDGPVYVQADGQDPIKVQEGFEIPQGDITGSLDMCKELLTHKYDFSGESGESAGIPYYQEMWNQSARKFAELLNEANSMVDENNVLKADAPVKAENYYQTNADGEFLDANGDVLTPNADGGYLDANGVDQRVARKQYQGGTLFEASGGGLLTAKNIAVSQDWINGKSQVMQSNTDTSLEQTTQNSGLRHLLSIMKDNKVEYQNKNGDPIFTGSFAEMLTKLDSTLAIDTSKTQAELNNYVTSLNELTVDRDSISGVDLNDEAIAMMQYNKSYSAACRFMTQLDQMLDKLINGTAV